MAWVMFHQFKLGQLDNSANHGQIDFDAASALQIILLTSAANPASYVATWDDVTAMLADATEVSGTNYARKTLSGNDATPSSGTITVDASDPSAYSQSASGFNNARYAILAATGADASAGLVAYYDFGSNKGNTTGNLTLQFSSAGIFTLT